MAPRGRQQQQGSGPSKTLWHGELVRMGEVAVVVKSDIKQSQFQGRPDYVMLDIDGVERAYNIESDDCRAAFDGQKGAAIVIKASGSGKSGDAAVDYIEDWDPQQGPTQRQPPPEPPPRQQTQQRQPPPQQQAPAQNGAKAPPDRTPGEEANWGKFRIMVARRLSMLKCTLQAMALLKAEWKVLTGTEMPNDIFLALHQDVLVSCDRAMVKESVRYAVYADALPVNVDFKTLKVVKPGQPPAEEPPKQKRGKANKDPEPPAEAPPQTPANPEPAEPQSDDVPF